MKDYFENLKGYAGKSRRREKRMKNKVIDAKLNDSWPHVSPHHRGDAEMVLMSLWKVSFGHRKGPHTPSTY